MSLSANFPTIRPSLALDFASSRSLDPRITFTRASTATYYDDHTVAKAEENLLLRSQEFDNASWTKTEINVSTDAAVAPDGTSTAEILTDTAVSAIHRAFQAPGGFVVGQPYTLSVYVKAGTHNFVQLLFSKSDGGSHYLSVVFNLSTGAATQTDSSNVSGASSSITAVGNSWYRCTITATATSAAFVVACVNFAPAASGNTIGTQGFITYTGTGTTFQIWGAQLEQRSAVTAYTATTTAPITNYIPQLLTAAANVARFEHNPVTRESLGLEIEESRTNLVTYSEQFDNAAWAKSQLTVTPNVLVAPDGTLSADKIVEDTTASVQHRISSASVSLTSGTAYSFSVYAKAGEVTNIDVFASAGFSAGPAATFNLSTGTITSQPTGNSSSASIASVGNGWYRCALIATADSTTTALFRVRLNNGGSTYTGNGYNGLYLWGAQLEAGSFPTSYIPTVAAQVTRSADAASMTGTNFSSWYRADEGTVYSDFVSSGYTANQMIYSVTDGTLTSPLQVYFSAANTIAMDAWGTGTITQTPVAQNTAYKYALGIALNNFGVSINAGAVASDTTVFPARSYSQLNIGNRNGSLIFNGTIKKLAYYPARLTNAQLQALTLS